MKKFILSLMLLAAGIVTVSATPVNNPATDPHVQAVFQKEFAGAEHVKWDEQDGYARVIFVLGGNRTIAWFSKEGELIGSVRDLLYNQLPLAVMTSVDKRFKDASFFNIREVNNEEGTRYKLTLEAKGRRYHVSVYPDGNMDTVERVRKP